nr:MAG TPA: hypothetical protein [Crassvirales sp.]
MGFYTEPINCRLTEVSSTQTFSLERQAVITCGIYRNI